MNTTVKLFLRLFTTTIHFMLDKNVIIVVYNCISTPVCRIFLFQQNTYIFDYYC